MPKWRTIEDNSDDSTNIDSWWDKIAKETCQLNLENWQDLMNNDEISFQRKFKDAYLENCKDWLVKLDDFLEKDDVWLSILESKEKMFGEIEERDEAILSAIDARRYKIFKTIDWSMVNDEIEEAHTSDTSEPDSAESTENLMDDE
jgi:hypothetical protein